MQFQNAIITNEGVRIFQAALANNPVVFTKCLFSGSSTPLTGSMTALPEPTWGNGHVTNYAANDNGGDFIIYASATNATDYGYAYGYGIYGYLQNEGIENEKLLVVANYDGNVTYVSEASGPYTRFHFAITIKLSMANEVISIAPHYNDLVSDAAFQNLANRTVTTHTAVDPNAGDDQTVRGHKEFTDGIGIWDSNNGWGLEITNYENNEGKNAVLLRTTNGAYYGSTIELVPKIAENQSYTKNDIKFNANLIPYDDGLSLGAVGHPWLEIDAIDVWASDTIGVSDQYGSTNMKANGLDFLNAEGDSVGGIGLHNDTQLLINGNGAPVHIDWLAVDGSMGVGGTADITGTLYARSALYAMGGLQCTGNFMIDQVTMTGVGNYLSINKSITVTGNVTSTELHLSGNMIGINGSGGEPYYMMVSGGVLRIGMNYNGGSPTGGGIRVSALTAESANLRFSSFGFTDGAQLDDGNYPFMYQTPETMTNPQIPMGCMFMAFVSCPSPILIGNRIPAAATINAVDLVPDNSGSVDMSLNALVIQRSNVPNGMGFVALSPVTFYDNTRQEYVNITLVMRVA